MPWEISLPSDTVAHPLYTKSGGLPGHTSLLLISPHLSYAVIAFACGPATNAPSLAFETERVITPLMQQVVGERVLEEYGGIYKSNCSRTECDKGCGEIIIEVSSEMKITQFTDCDGNDIFGLFKPECIKKECFAKLWPAGREGEFRFVHEMNGVDCRASLSSTDGGCDKIWGGFEPMVVNGWPIDLIRIEAGKVIYRPLGIEAKKVPPGDDDFTKGRTVGGKDGLFAWRDEAPFDMEW